MERKTSIKRNIILSGIKACSTVLFPLITFKLAASRLTVSYIGRVDYVSSINGLFVLLAGLGINTYCVREFSGYRTNKELFGKFANEAFSINVVSTVFSYCLYFLVVFCIPSLNDYKLLFGIFSIQILFATLGTDWINTIFEDFLYITVRSIFIQVFCLVAVIVFIHSPEDYYFYAVITMLSMTLPNILNLVYVRKKYIKVSFCFQLNLKEHIKPILYLFSISVATVIFVNSDKIVLGYISGEYYTGLYSAATKIYLGAKQVLLMCISTTIPRIAYMIAKDDKEKVLELLKKIENGLLFFSIPIAIGLVMISSDAIVLTSDESYLPATNAFSILALTLIICSASYFYSSCIMVPLKMEKKLLLTTTIGAVSNVLLNIIMIRMWNHTAAAITTLIAELLVLIMDIHISRKTIKIKFEYDNLLQILIGCSSIIAICMGVRFIGNMYMRLIFSVLFSSISYFFIMILLKNRYMLYWLQSFRKLIDRRKN